MSNFELPRPAGCGKVIGWKKGRCAATNREKDRFDAACRRVAAARSEGGSQGGIGTLGEKTLHAVLKCYYEPDETKHEVPVAGCVTDIHTGAGIIEIQTRGFEKLNKKLPRLVKEGPVTVVYPIPATKWLVWVDPETGECTNRRKSPRRGRPSDIFFEMYKIRRLLGEPGLTFRLLFLDIEEYRLRNGWSYDGKRGATRQERMPLTLREEIVLGGPHGWGALLPDALPEAFTSRDYARDTGAALKMAQRGLNILRGVGAIEQVGKQGRLLLYERAESEGSVGK